MFILAAVDVLTNYPVKHLAKIPSDEVHAVPCSAVAVVVSA